MKLIFLATFVMMYGHGMYYEHDARGNIKVRVSGHHSVFRMDRETGETSRLDRHCYLDVLGKVYACRDRWTKISNQEWMQEEAPPSNSQE